MRERGLLGGTGVEPPRGSGRPSGGRESKLFFGYVTTNISEDPLDIVTFTTKGEYLISISISNDSPRHSGKREIRPREGLYTSPRARRVRRRRLFFSRCVREGRCVGRAWSHREDVKWRSGVADVFWYVVTKISSKIYLDIITFTTEEYCILRTSGTRCYAIAGPV